MSNLNDRLLRQRMTTGASLMKRKCFNQTHADFKHNRIT